MSDGTAEAGFLQGAGELRALFRARDWSATALGPPAQWRQELVTAVDLMLHAGYPAVVIWGPEHTFLYNDAYAYILGTRHPAALGQPFPLVWPEIWPQLRSTVESAMAGTPAYCENMPVTIAPDGVPQERWFTSSYSPVRDREGRVLGMFNAGFETSGRMMDERRLAFQLVLADKLRPLSSPEDIVAVTAEMLGSEVGVSRLVYAEVDQPQEHFFIQREWLQPGVASIAGQVRRLEDFGPEVVALLRSGQLMVVHDVVTDPRTAAFAQNYAAIGVRSNLAVPVVKTGQLVVVLSLHMAQPRRWTDQDVRLVQEVAERSWLAVQAARAEATLRETQTWMSAMFDSLPVGVGVFDTKGNAKLANHAMQRYLPTGRLPSRDAVRRGRWRAVGPDGLLVAPEDFPGARATRGERVVPGMEVLYTADDGQGIWTQVAAVPIRDAQGAVTGQVSVVHEIDALKRTETALRQSESRYRALFLKMDAGFCILQVQFDPGGDPVDVRYVETNPMFHEQTGMDEVVGKSLRELVPDIEQFWIDRYAQVVRTGEPVRFESYSEAFDRWFDVNAFPVGDPQDLQVAVLFSDVSKRRRFEDEQRRLTADLAEANRRQSEFLAVLAHELRNPLAPILTGLELMRLRPDDAPTSARVREIVERQTRQMVHLIDDLLDIARVTSGKIEIRRQPVDLHTALATAVETSLPLIEKSGHELSVHRHEGALPLLADPTRLAQVFSNLLTNAARYTPSGGKIRLSVEKDADEVIVSVADNGVGIPAGSLASIFEMFSQVERDADTSHGGLGIGLALVRQLVSLHGGTVKATSDGPGQGSTFIVRLPLSTHVLQAPDPVAAPPPPSPRARRVLVADDNVDAAQSLAALLELHGHETLVAHDGLQALQVAAEHVPEVMFLDIGMPGLTGYEVARQLRTLPVLQRATLVAVTGWGTEEDRARAREAGFDGHLTKPVAPEAIARWLEAGQG